MKKMLLILGTLLVVTSLTYAVGDKEVVPQVEGVVTEDSAPASESPTTGIVFSKGDSFMIAFGMKESPVVGQHNPAATTVAHTSGHASATMLTSIQNTPYSYK